MLWKFRQLENIPNGKNVHYGEIPYGEILLYQFEIQFPPGKKHVSADALSRAPQAASEAIEGTDEDEMEQ